VAEVEVESEEVENPEEGEVTNEETEAEDAEELADEEDDDSEEEEPEEGNVLSQKHEKTFKKMRKRIDKATKNWRTAQEETASLKGENEELRKQISSGNSESSGEKSFADMAGIAEDMKSLEDIYEKAEKAEEWADDALEQLNASGEDVLVVEDKEYSRSEINAFKKETKKALKKDIPARARLFEEKVEYDKFVVENFDFMKDKKSEGYKLTQQYMADKELSKFANSRSDGMLMIALAAEGQIALNAKQKQSLKGEDKTKETVKKPVSTPKIAPSVLGIRNTVAPARLSSDEKSVKVKNDILKKNNVTKNDLTQLFM
jgi:hypothetical protein